MSALDSRYAGAREEGASVARKQRGDERPRDERRRPSGGTWDRRDRCERGDGKDCDEDTSGRDAGSWGTTPPDPDACEDDPTVVTIQLAPASLPAGTVGTSYGTHTITAAGGTAPYTFSLASGTLPPGASLTSAGILSGTPTTAGTYTFVIAATDAMGASGSRSYSVQISPRDPATLTISPDALNPSTVIVGTTLPQEQFTVSGGVGPYRFALVAGTLPPGTALSSGGSFGGTAVTPGVFTFTLVATDSSPLPGPLSSAPKSFTLSVVRPTITIAPATLGPMKVGVLFEAQLATTGGFGPHTYSLVAGSLPPGIAFSSTGRWAGTPVTSGTFTSSVRSTDRFGSTGTQTYAIVVEP
ncbi:MAG: putative Ig domain-containing protein [Labilithrix sp.]|nr:putative Ig domain-containing protein [Labilithrix sp.]